MERRPATDEVHADDSYGGCVSCRIIDLNGPWDANHDDAVTTTVPWPCLPSQIQAGAVIVTEEELAAAMEIVHPMLISGPYIDDYPPSPTRPAMLLAKKYLAAIKEQDG